MRIASPLRVAVIVNLLSVPAIALADPIGETGDADATSGDYFADGALDAASVTHEMGLRSRAMASCYERELRHHPRLAGRVELAFTVDASGTVRRTTLARDGLHSRPVARCLKNLLDGARFPAPAAGPMRFAYPVTFRTAPTR